MNSSSLVQRFQRIPEDERVHAVRLCRSVLDDALHDTLEAEGENPIFKSKLASILANCVRRLRDEFPEADDMAPMRTVVTYESD